MKLSPSIHSEARHGESRALPVPWTALFCLLAARLVQGQAQPYQFPQTQTQQVLPIQQGGGATPGFNQFGQQMPGQQLFGQQQPAAQQSFAPGTVVVQEIVHCDHVKATSMMASIAAIFPSNQLHVVLGPESFSPKLESVSLATTTASEIRAIQGSTEAGHLAKELILIGDEKTVKQAREMVKKLDYHREQVRLRLKVTDISFDGLHQLGITYDFSKYSIRENSAQSSSGIVNALRVAQLGHLPISIDATLAALEQRNQSKTLAEPTISLLDGERGFILIGDKIFYPKLTGYTQAQTPIYDKEEVRVGIYVQVALEMAGHGDMILAVYPQVSTITGYLNVAGASYPQISTREQQTTVRLHENETLVIGGLISDQEIKNLTEIPFISRIPFLGELFRNRKNTTTKKDLVIMITPEILREGDMGAEIVADGHGHEGASGTGGAKSSPLAPSRPKFPAAPPPAPFGLPPMKWPESNPYSAEKAELGWLLFFDKRLSRDKTVACANCHLPEEAFTDGRERPLGVGRAPGRRNSPTIINAGYYAALGWNGESSDLESQARAAITSPIEMDLDEAGMVAAIAAIPEYQPRFRKVFGSKKGTIDLVTKAIATFERLVVSGRSPYDQFMAGDKTALTAVQQRGLSVFGKQCASCHAPPLFTDGKYSSLGVGKRGVDSGRMEVTGVEADRNRFRTPGLRELGFTGPYMHDGSLPDLDSVFHLYEMGPLDSPGMDPRAAEINLTNTDVSDLTAFLKSLHGEGWQRYRAP